MFERILEVFLDALKDSAITFPILFICYLLIELLEEKLLHKYQSSKVLRSRAAPIISAGIGLIPQCGFSIVASDLYSKRVITIGTLFAIFIATSDEALPIMLANPNNYANLAIILLIKFCYAVLVGLIIDAIFTKKNKQDAQVFLNKNAIEIDHHHDNNKKVKNNDIDNTDDISKKIDNKKTEKENHSHVKNAIKTHNLKEQNQDQIVVFDNEEIHGCCKHKLEHESNKFKEIFIHPLKHSLIIFAYIFIINMVFGLIVEFVGETAIVDFLSGTGFFEPFIATLVGLIPNCAASVILTEVFIMGGISIGSCIAGLCVNSGLAIIMLFKMNKNIKENILILIGLYVLSCTLGIIINLF